MDSIETYQIKTKLDFYFLKDMAEKKLFKSSEIWIKQIKEAVILIFLCIIGIIFMIGLDDDFALSKLVVYVSIVLMIYAIIFAVLMLRRSVIKIRVNIDAYKCDLRKIEDKLIFSDAAELVKITEEEYREYDSVWHILKIYLKRMKKST